MTQLPLELRARARATDPGPSHAAARSMNDSGAAASHAALVLTALKQHGPSTYRELARHVPELEAAEVQRRLDGLRKAGLARTGSSRACSVTRREAQVWIPTVTG